MQREIRPAGCLRALSFAAALTACGTSPGLPSDARFLRGGVDVESEAAAISATLARAGWTEVQRVVDPSFVALGFERAGRAAVRLVTARGTMIALPPVGAEEEAESYVLDERWTARDLDGDRRGDVVVGWVDEALERTCLVVVRVTRGGYVAPVRADFGGLGDHACVEDLVDVDRDGHVDAIVGVRFPELGLGPGPAIRAPLRYDAGQFVAPPPAAMDAFAELQVLGRTSALEAARRQNAASEALRIGVELAALARLRGQTPGAQLEVFDRAIEGALGPTGDPALSRAAARARRIIAEGWGSAPTAPTEEATPPTPSDGVDGASSAPPTPADDGPR
jgi:hypothetical protein